MDNQLDQLMLDYNNLRESIKSRLDYFKQVPQDQYFYEMIYCLCTPMSKAVNALKVQEKLQSLNYINKEADISSILRNPEHYIRFHNQKAKFIQYNKSQFEKIYPIINRNSSPIEKRKELVDLIMGFGFKEASHFLRNIGIFGLAILDRHILKNLVNFQIIPKDYKINSYKNYREIENKFVNFAEKLNMNVEELDLLLWARQTGEILK
jgi:N-glycosylase/DNA lyase